MSFRNLDFLVEESVSGSTMKLAVAAAQDAEVLKAVHDAAKREVVEPVLFGDLQKIEAIAKDLKIDLSTFEVVDETDESTAAEKAVKSVSSGESDLLMKGNVKTAT
ncbi:MAG: Phosphate butyryltransferase, partial [Synergistales bacterium 54_9]